MEPKRKDGNKHFHKISIVRIGALVPVRQELLHEHKRLHITFVKSE